MRISLIDRSLYYKVPDAVYPKRCRIDWRERIMVMYIGRK